ncbi:MAG: hypothetical protein QOH12_2261 [Solirubrobacteraceae bacterium]|jgi:hypothetical protein|nr:hypothetical protein [Solirubrobacteraceae bacterium]
MKNQRVERLRTTVDFLPPETKRAMLDGLERNRIIAGANTDRRGGMCPMIAADRNAFESGPMADIFAAVWDGYNGTCILNRREASERDLRLLKTMLETSLANSPEYSTELGQAWLDYHVGPDAGVPGAEVDFDRDLTSALEQSALHDARSFAPALGAPPAPRQIELVYDGDPIPAGAAPPAGRTRLAGPPTDRTGGVRPASPATGTAMNSPYEPYTIATPKRRAAAARGPVDQRVDSRASGYAAQTNATAERARARAIIANQAATLRGRDWPRSAASGPVAGAAGAAARAARVEVEAPRHELAATPLEAPAIRQAAIPQLRGNQAAQGHGRGPVSDRLDGGRAPESSDRSAGLEAATGWSLLPPLRSYDDYEGEGRETTGTGLESDPRGAPEDIQPSGEPDRTVRT